MGGPWRARGVDSVAWRTPQPRVEVRAAAPPAERDKVTWIVVTYVATVFVSFAVMLTLMKHGW